MSINVLIVDDSSVMRSMVKRVLKMSEIPVKDIFEASNGQEGLSVIENSWIDLLLVDINMPVMSGDVLIEKLRANPTTNDLAIIVISSESSETTIEKLTNQGARFIHKPFAPEELQDTVRALLGDLNG